MISAAKAYSYSKVQAIEIVNVGLRGCGHFLEAGADPVHAELNIFVNLFFASTIWPCHVMTFEGITWIGLEMCGYFLFLIPLIVINLPTTHIDLAKISLAVYTLPRPIVLLVGLLKEKE